MKCHWGDDALISDYLMLKKVKIDHFNKKNRWRQCEAQALSISSDDFILSKCNGSDFFAHLNCDRTVGYLVLDPLGIC